MLHRLNSCAVLPAARQTLTARLSCVAADVVSLPSCTQSTLTDCSSCAVDHSWRSDHQRILWHLTHPSQTHTYIHSHCMITLLYHNGIKHKSCSLSHSSGISSVISAYYPAARICLRQRNIQRNNARLCVKPFISQLSSYTLTPCSNALTQCQCMALTITVWEHTLDQSHNTKAVKGNMPTGNCCKLQTVQNRASHSLWSVWTMLSALSQNSWQSCK